jgi:hypothetical protein
VILGKRRGQVALNAYLPLKNKEIMEGKGMPAAFLFEPSHSF